ncbi:MAG: GAF domain-containing protein [Gammaproteobacteria bacterium]|nr:GAF domain-containing protein [Gammaproteobacteria bacterium]MDH4314802.1 GAF domain-containing protein [Gammaproteobacteria bacterium]MDH5213077.1 GAF domain-containing protein [Gammaproteobacteria bacterium]MDH5500182.1 GAF domain-containing protein [Gammaproteobacteria bacterium]
MNNETDYELLAKQAEVLLSDEPDPLANTANFVALINEYVSNINWVGVYVLRGNELVLGPFQGKPACVHIPLGKGVCGTAAQNKKTLRVADVHAFKGHIACDTASNSELVVPLISGERLLGVLDVDSPQHDRFSAADQAGLEALCTVFIRALQASGNKFI